MGLRNEIEEGGRWICADFCEDASMPDWCGQRRGKLHAFGRVSEGEVAAFEDRREFTGVGVSESLRKSEVSVQYVSMHKVTN
jgi:hypothetical protein